MKASVIFSTYNSPLWLEKVLWGFACQSDTNFEVIIADDGSTDETRRVIDTFSASSPFELKHVWQPDNGFQKCKILNKAIVAATGDYLIMTDGDCIPRADFVAEHRAHSEAGYYLSGGYFKLPMSISESVTRQDIEQGHVFDKAWLQNRGMRRSLKFMKLTPDRTKARIYNALTRTSRSWNGHNSSCFKRDALRVNGFDERMRYGGEDAEFGGRLWHSGVKAKQIRYSAICVHLDHPRSYVSEEDWEWNRAIRKVSDTEKLIVTPSGIKESNA